MAFVLSSAIFSYRDEVTESISFDIAELLLGQHCRLHQADADFDECDRFVGRPLSLLSRAKGVGVAIYPGAIVVVSGECGEWIETEIPTKFAAICRHINSELALAITLDEHTGACGYMLCEGHIIRRVFVNDCDSEFEFGPIPNFERELRDKMLGPVDVADGMAQLLLPAPLTQFVNSLAFKLWSRE